MAPCSLTEGLHPWQGGGVFLKILLLPAFSGSIKRRVQGFTLQNKTKSGIFLLPFSQSNELSYEPFPWCRLPTLGLCCRQLPALWEGNISHPQEGPPVTAHERAPKHPLPYELSPASGPGRPGNHSWSCPSLVTPVPPSHPCSSTSSAQTLSSLKSQGTATSFTSGKGEAALSQLRGWDDRAVPGDALQKTPCS